jgi:hypothetical protein
MTNSVVMIVPAVHTETLNALGDNLGYGPNTWNVPLSASGASPATHYGTHVWEVSGSQFQGLRMAIQAGITPPGLEAYAIELASVYVKVADLSTISQISWAEALAENNLVKIEEG